MFKKKKKTLGTESGRLSQAAMLFYCSKISSTRGSDQLVPFDTTFDLEA